MYKEVVRRTKTPEQALSQLMRLCSKAERSTGDARRLMRTWGVEADSWGGVIDKLVEMRFIDDRRFADAFVRDKSKFAGWGIYKIRAGLVAKGVSKEIIAEALQQVDGESGRERLREVLMRKLRTVKFKDNYDRKVKLMRYGVGRGFDHAVVMDIIDEIIRDCDEE